MKKPPFAILLVALAFSMLGAQTLDDRKKKAEGLVTRAVSALATQGQTAVFAQINDKKGPFTQGEFYIFVYDLDGICLAHGQQVEKIGKPLIALTDINGLPYIQTFTRIAKSEKGQGWTEYVMKNPVTSKPQKKMSFIMRVPGKSYYMGCGTYIE